MVLIPQGWPGASRPTAVLVLAAVAIAAVVVASWIGSLVSQTASRMQPAPETSSIGALISEFKAIDLVPALPSLAPNAEDAAAAPTF
ncbi:hypothetical protein [Ramlibacter algicola]|uniref:Uncharacterized protein n=1 Tax=Ramlibacter algicola TaxID=2795217 RepID=A0A934Q0D4_9BURK|nr:hypothetical protein [Ramlibacter algicola]MBK0392327.1 hypothetical protein [Ramlibacter algicola]